MMNPELHLHPQLQYKFHAHLRDSSSQVLVSTHSEAMIDIGDWRTIKRIDCMQKCFPGQNMLSNMLEYKGTSKSLEENLDELKQYYKDKSIFFRK